MTDLSLESVCPKCGSKNTKPTDEGCHLCLNCGTLTIRGGPSKESTVWPKVKAMADRAKEKADE